jgi:quercetin dioxygenase-like cupin family protein
MMRRTAVAMAIAWIPIAAGSSAQVILPQALAPERTSVLENSTVAATHLRFAPGARETPHTHPFPLLIVQLTPSTEVSVTAQELVMRGSKPGEVWYIAPDRLHAVANPAVAKGPVELLAIALLPTRQPAPAAPPTDAPPGVTRSTLVDNDQMRVVRVRFDPGAHEPVHAHPNDLLTVQITGGKMEILQGTWRTSEVHEPGFVQFLPRGLSHMFGDADTKPLELISVAIK